MYCFFLWFGLGCEGELLFGCGKYGEKGDKAFKVVN